MIEKEEKEFLQDLYNLINKINSLDEVQKIQVFLDNIQKIVHLSYEISTYNMKFQHPIINDAEQIELSKIYFDIIKWIVENSEMFKLTEYYDYVPDMILNSYLDRENHIAFKIAQEQSMDLFYSLKEYNGRRSQLEEIIKAKDNKSSAQNRYLNSHDEYFKLYFSHALTFCELQFMKVPKEDIKSLLIEIEKSEYLDEIFLKEDKKLSFYNQNLIFQYAMFAIKLKSKVKSDEILDDKVIQALWNGQIKNKQIINILLDDSEKEELKRKRKIFIGDILDVDFIFRSLLKREGYNGNFLKGIAEHFKNVGLPDEYIAEIFNNIISKCRDYSVLQFYADLGNKELDNMAEYSFMYYSYSILEDIHKVEESVSKGRCFDLPYDYVVGNLVDLSEEALQNIITLIAEGFYEEDNEQLKNIMIKHGLIKNGQLSEEKIEFNENDIIENIKSKVKLAFEERKVIPYDIAVKIIRECFDNDLEIDEIIFKSCLVSVIHYTLVEQGIDIGHRIFFGENNNTRGLHRSGNKNLIWINNSLIRNFVNTKISSCEDKAAKLIKKSDVFITAFHEMKHAKQFDNIKKGNIDFLTYNFIKEQVLRKYDDNFYDANYLKMFIEEDARQYGIIDAMMFLKSIGIKGFDKIFSNYKNSLRKEIGEGNINVDSEKKHSFRGKIRKINNTNYLGMLIQYNSNILDEYNSLLRIEFNDDGSLKDVKTMLDDYELRKSKIENDENYNHNLENLYSIYYGLFRQMSEKNPNLTDEERKLIMDFSKHSDKLVSVDDLRYYATRTDVELVTSVMESFERDVYNIGIQDVAHKDCISVGTDAFNGQLDDERGDDENEYHK